jgi:hypothetical protein
MANFNAGASQESVVRSVWRYQPIVPVAVAFAGGVTLDSYLSVKAVWWLPLVFGALLLWTVALVRRNRTQSANEFGFRSWVSSLLLLLAIAAVGGTWHHVYWHVYPSDDIGHWCDRKGKPARLRGILIEEPLVVRGGPPNPLRVMPEGDRTVCQIAVRHIEAATGWVTASGKAHVVVDGNLSGMHAGDSVEK